MFDITLREALDIHEKFLDAFWKSKSRSEEMYFELEPPITQGGLVQKSVKMLLELCEQTYSCKIQIGQMPLAEWDDLFDESVTVGVTHIPV